jgi:hypothetical protein
MKNAEAIGKWLRNTPIVVYDQDPWQSYMDDSPYKGAYDVIARHMNVASFALTTKWWADFVASKGHPTTFVRMWVLPEYCVMPAPYSAQYVDRQHVAGFVGTVHPRRQQLLDVIEASGIKTNVLRTNSLSYQAFLSELTKLRIFVHNEDMTYRVDDQELNFNTGMWVKDVEAASQGCFSIRSRGAGAETYLEGIETVRLYDDISEVPSIIRAIENMDPQVRQASIDRSVEHIRRSNKWQETAIALTTFRS